MAKRTPKQEAELNTILASQLPIISKAAPKAGKMKFSIEKGLEVVKAKVEKVKEEKKPKKADIARQIYAEMIGQPRKDVLKRFQDEAKLTKAGANTYYALMKAASGI